VKKLFYLNRPEERHRLEGRHLFGGDILAGTFAVRQCQLLGKNNIFVNLEKLLLKIIIFRLKTEMSRERT
jgi:hypothetical protein